MCQRLRDILFPTNILGKDKRTIRFYLPDGISTWTPNIAWTGKSGSSCTLSLTRQKPDGTLEVWKDVKIPQPVYQPVFINIDTQPFVENCIYFKCTDVTSLIVNGETLI